MEPRKCFTFFLSFYTAISELSDDQQLEMYRSVAEYALFGAEPQLSGTLNALFSLMRPNIDSSNKKRDNGKKGGMLGGAPIGNQNALKNNSNGSHSLPEDTVAIDLLNSKTKQIKAETKQNQTDIEIEEEIEKEKEVETESEVESAEEKEGLGEKETTLSPADEFLSRHSDYENQDLVLMAAQIMRDRQQARLANISC